MKKKEENSLTLKLSSLSFVLRVMRSDDLNSRAPIRTLLRVSFRETKDPRGGIYRYAHDFSFGSASRTRVHACYKHRRFVAATLQSVVTRGI